MRSAPVPSWLILSLGLWVPAATAAAEDAPCRDDVARFCESVDPAKGARGRCLRAHLAELSPACRARVESRRGGRPGNRGGRLEKVGGVREHCVAELDTLCADDRGTRREVRCLREHQDALSEACAEKLPKKAGRRLAAPER